MSRTRSQNQQVKDLSQLSNADVETFAPVVRALIFSSNYGDALSFEEKFAAGIYGAAFGVASFDSTRGRTLKSWVRFKADSQIRSEIRKELRRRKIASRPLRFDERDERDRGAVDPSERIERREEYGVFQGALERLDARSRRIVLAIAVDGKKQKEVALAEGCS